MPRATFLLLMLAALPARADPAWMIGTTWLRASPSDTARVLDEVSDGQRVERQGCAEGWCRVLAGRAPGYVPAAMLGTAPRPALRRAAGECFPGQHFTPAGPIALVFCPASP